MSTLAHSATAHVFACLAGTWHLQRDIVSDIAEQPSGMLQGKATFLSEGEGLYTYSEAGQLQTALGEHAMTRRYVYAYDASTEQIGIFHHAPDGRGALLHALVFCAAENAYEASHKHVCGEDVYEVTYRYTQPHRGERRLRVHYRVHGPAKKYAMVSNYRG